MSVRTHARLTQGLVLLALLFFGSSTMAIEEPDFEVIQQDGNLEIRRYAPFVVAETLVDVESRDAASNAGFRLLFGYISGKNKAREKIKMTAPVIQTGSQTDGEKIAMTAPVQQTRTDAGWRVAFVLPLQYTLATAPLPADPRISLREVAPRTMAVLRFSGRWSDDNIEKHRLQLLARLEERSTRLLGKVEFAAYNAPFALPFMRRNEVMVEIDGS